MPRLILSLTLALLLPLSASAQCRIGSAALPQVKNHDLLFRLLSASETCPANVQDLREQLSLDGMKLVPTMVANRGFHNPGAGSFSLFEMAEGQSAKTGLTLKSGDFFFGHFTEANGPSLELAQAPRPGALMVELIAWDPAKKLYNFYELIGAGKEGQWFYRGDSADIAADVSQLHLQKDPSKPVFGQRLRCSGCHTNGGPIMKELALPHNDWWAPERPLPLGGRAPAGPMAEILKDLAPAQVLAAAVRTGMEKLAVNAAPRSLPEMLRPLFCPVELNLSSDVTPKGAGALAQIPGAFFVDPRLAQISLPVASADHERAIERLGFRFPETSRNDADHAWLTPVKAESDKILAELLVKEGIITEKFLLGVLAVDFTNPVFSASRCNLLRYIPERAAPGWETLFIARLQAMAKVDRFAAEAAENLTNPLRNPAWFRARAQGFLTSCHAQIEKQGPEPYLALLAQRRAEARASEISKNPRGQILEPGFRVIFPEPAVPAIPGKLRLTTACEIEGA